MRTHFSAGGTISPAICQRTALRWIENFVLFPNQFASPHAASRIMHYNITRLHIHNHTSTSKPYARSSYHEFLHSTRVRIIRHTYTSQSTHSYEFISQFIHSTRVRIIRYPYTYIHAFIRVHITIHAFNMGSYHTSYAYHRNPRIHMSSHHTTRITNTAHKPSHNHSMHRRVKKFMFEPRIPKLHQKT